MLKESRSEAIQKLKDERRKKKKAEKKELLKLAKERQKKNVNINKLTSISGGNQNRGADTRACHKCGEVGHLQSDCPKRKRGGDDYDDPRPRKSRKSG